MVLPDPIPFKGAVLTALSEFWFGIIKDITPTHFITADFRAIAAKIASQSILALMMNKEMVDAAYETTLTQGVRFERRLFHSLFAFDDQKEGMGAFVEKRKPDFKGR